MKDVHLTYTTAKQLEDGLEQVFSGYTWKVYVVEKGGKVIKREQIVKASERVLRLVDRLQSKITRLRRLNRYKWSLASVREGASVQKVSDGEFYRAMVVTELRVKAVFALRDHNKRPINFNVTDQDHPPSTLLGCSVTWEALQHAYSVLPTHSGNVRTFQAFRRLKVAYDDLRVHERCVIDAKAVTTADTQRKAFGNFVRVCMKEVR